MCVAVTIKRLAFNVLHNEVRQAVVSCAAIEQARDKPMVERRKYLAFLAKAPQDKVCIHATLHQLDRNAQSEFVVDTQRFINSAHAAPPNLALDAIGTQPAPDHRVLVVVVNKRLDGTQLSRTASRLLKQTAGTVMLE